MTDQKIKIIFCGGGTAGHIFPLIAVAREMRRLSNFNISICYIGPYDQISKNLFFQEDIKVYNIFSGKIRRYFSLINFTDSILIFLGIIQSFFILLFLKPKLVFGKGGTGSISVIIASALLGIPIFIHESDSIPGLSNKINSKFAKKIFVSFPKTRGFDQAKITLTGNPVLKELFEGSARAAKEIFRIASDKPVLLFLGGSQGAQSINDFLLQILPDLIKKYEIIHVTGQKNWRQVKAESEIVLPKEFEVFYHVYPFLQETELKHAYSLANLIISRAGSGSIFEIAQAGKPSILIPLPGSAGNHQKNNAYEYAGTGAAIVIEQENLIPNFFMEKIKYLLANEKELENMKNNALRFSKPLAAKAIAREILEHINNAK